VRQIENKSSRVELPAEAEIEAASWIDEEQKKLLRMMSRGEDMKQLALWSIMAEAYTTVGDLGNLKDDEKFNAENVAAVQEYFAHRLGQEYVLRTLWQKLEAAYNEHHAERFGTIGKKGGVQKPSTAFKNTHIGRMVRKWTRKNLMCGALTKYTTHVEYKRSDKKVSIALEPTRGFVADNYAAIADACWAPDYSIVGKLPNVTIVKHVKNPTSEHRKLAGAHVLCETRVHSLEDWPNPVSQPTALVVVGINPLENLAREVDAEEFCVQVLRHAWDTAQKRGIGDVLVCLDDFRHGATNRATIWQYLEQLKAVLQKVRLQHNDLLSNNLKNNVGPSGEDIREKCFSIKKLAAVDFDIRKLA
jgi:hypothetical protein